MVVYYPVLVSEIAKREIQKKTIAQSIGVCYKSFNNKMSGKTPFTWPEVKTIRREFFRIFLLTTFLQRLTATLPAHENSPPGGEIRICS